MKKTPPSPLTKLALADPYNSELAKSQKLPTSPSDDKETISKRSLKMESNSPSPNAVDAMLVNNENKGSKDCNKRSADCTPLDASTKQKKIRTTKIKDSPRLEAHAKAAIHYCDINSRIRMLFAKGVISKVSSILIMNFLMISGSILLQICIFLSHYIVDVYVSTHFCMLYPLH